MASDKGSNKGKDAETPEGAEGADGEASAHKGPPLKVLLIAGVAAVLVLGGGGAGAFLMLKPKPEAAGEHGKKPEKKSKKGDHGGKAEPGAAVVREGPDGTWFYTPADIVVNMQSSDGRPTFLKLKITYELGDVAIAETLDANAPRLQDMLQTFLRELRPEDLTGSQGSYQLRMEILRRVNLVVAPTKVNAVLIEEMLIN